MAGVDAEAPDVVVEGVCTTVATGACTPMQSTGSVSAMLSGHWSSFLKEGRDGVHFVLLRRLEVMRSVASGGTVPGTSDTPPFARKSARRFMYEACTKRPYSNKAIAWQPTTEICAHTGDDCKLDETG